jgi:hypothetical protein
MAISVVPDDFWAAHLTGHAIDRWRDRMPPDTIDPWQALVLATHVPGIQQHSKFRDHEHGTPSAVYGYGGVTRGGIEYYAVFLEVDDTPRGSSGIVTTYQPAWPAIHDRVVREVERAGGPIDESQYSAPNEHIDHFYNDE